MIPDRHTDPNLSFLSLIPIGNGERSYEVVQVGSVIKKRRKKMRKHKQRKLLKRQRHKK
jgi:hypothetical protein